MGVEVQDSTICKNCESNLDGKFCSNCGQKSKTVSINFKYLLQEIPNSIFQVDRGLLYTIKELFTRPGHSIREYVEGKRVRHFRPISFVLLIATLYAFSIVLIKEKTVLGNVIGGAVEGLIDAFNLIGKEREVEIGGIEKLRNLVSWIKNYFPYVTILLLPVYAFCTYISFSEKGLNYFEHLILNLYLEGQKLIIYLLFVPFLYFIPNGEIKGSLSIVQFFITMILFFWSFLQFFKETKKVSTTLRLLLSAIIYYMIFNLLGVFIGIVFYITST